MTHQGISQNSYQNNRGFSLVELLIAISILAIAIVPLLNGFISSIRLNSRTRGTLDGTMVAQDLVEGIRNSNSQTVFSQFVSKRDAYTGETKPGDTITGEDSAKTKWKNFTLFPEDLIDEGTGIYLLPEANALGFKVEDSDTLEEKLKKEVEARAKSSEKTQILIRNLKAGSSDLHYDAMITLNPEKYDEGTTLKNSSGDLLDYNNRGLASLTTMNGEGDVVFNEDRITNDLFREARVLDANGLFPDAAKPLTIGDLTRTIAVTVRREAEKTKVSIDIGYYYGDVRVDTSASTDYEVSELKNLYLIYYPGYELKNMSDTIKLYNADNLKFNFYILKQQRLDHPSVYSDELDYVSEGKGVSVKIYETALISVNICSNLDMNAADLTPLFTDDAKKGAASKIFHWYSDEDMLSEKVLSDEQKESFSPFSMSGSAGEKSKRMYQVSLEVYEEGYWEIKDDGSWEKSGDAAKKRTLSTLSTSVLLH